MKKNVAHSAVINFHRLFIPKINEELHNVLSSVLPDIVLQPIISKSSEVIQNAINAKPEFKINVDAKSPKDEPIVANSQKKVDSKKELLEQMQKAQQQNK
jgi:hypothetical protein